MDDYIYGARMPLGAGSEACAEETAVLQSASAGYSTVGLTDKFSKRKGRLGCAVLWSTEVDGIKGEAAMRRGKLVQLLNLTG